MASYFIHLKKFINDNVGKVITRNQILELCVIHDCDISNNTIDMYKYMCIKAGYIERTDKNGKYIVTRPLPDNMTKTKLKRECIEKGCKM